MDECEREIRAGNKFSRYCDSTNIHVRDVQLLNNSRNAMSVTGVVNLTVERSLLAQTGLVSGTCCRGGIDMEPETPYRHISNVTMREVTFAENGMTQVVLNLGGQGNNTDNILLDSCVIANSSTREDAGCGIWVIGISKDAPMGTITIRNTTIENIRDFGELVVPPERWRLLVVALENRTRQESEETTCLNCFDLDNPLTNSVMVSACVATLCVPFACLWLSFPQE